MASCWPFHKHGFPEFHYGWRRQFDDLAAAGYRVWAPDQRGYNLSDKPQEFSEYTLDKLAEDIIGLIDAAGEKTAIIVGHDWGAVVAWWLAGKYPDRLSKLVVMNVAHGAIMKKALRSNLSQFMRSWYIFFFQLPCLPEFLIRISNCYVLTKTLLRTSRKGTFNEQDIIEYKKAWLQPNACRSMINWYRAIVRKPSKPPTSSRIKVPTLLIWGCKDRFLGKEMAQPSIEQCDNGELKMIEEASHWVQHEEATQVNKLMLDFFNKN